MTNHASKVNLGGRPLWSNHVFFNSENSGKNMHRTFVCYIDISNCQPQHLQSFNCALYAHFVIMEVEFDEIEHVDIFPLTCMLKSYLVGILFK